MKNNLIPSNEKWFSGYGNRFFLPLSETAATACFIFPSDGNVFLNESCIPIRGNEFCG